MTRVVLIGGPYDGARPDLRSMPERITVRGAVYERLDDPDTREPLGGYVAMEEDR